jgi:hypothetical protein
MTPLVAAGGVVAVYERNRMFGLRKRGFDVRGSGHAAWCQPFDLVFRHA